MLHKQSQHDIQGAKTSVFAHIQGAKTPKLYRNNVIDTQEQMREYAPKYAV